MLGWLLTYTVNQLNKQFMGRNIITGAVFVCLIPRSILTRGIENYQLHKGVPAYGVFSNRQDDSTIRGSSCSLRIVMSLFSRRSRTF